MPRLLIKGRASLRLTARVTIRFIDRITARVAARLIAHEQLTAHAQMHHERLVGKRAVRLAQGQPQVLAAAVGTAQRLAGECRLKVGGTRQVPAQRTGIDHAHRPHGPTQRMVGNAHANGFHLGQFGHDSLQSARLQNQEPAELTGLQDA